MDEIKVNKIVFSSSAAVYGEPKEIPISERHPCVPTNPYGETKWDFEKVLQAFHDAGKLNFISLRYFNAAGADPEGGLGEDHSPETHLIPWTVPGAKRRGERLIGLLLAGAIRLNFPLLSVFSVNRMVFGIPVLYLYLLSVWVLLIFVKALILRGRPAAPDPEQAGGRGIARCSSTGSYWSFPSAI